MNSTDTSVRDRQAARRHLVMMAGTLVTVLVVINVIALYGLDVVRRETDAYAAATDRLIEATDRAREGQVAFKTQVQEWKNVLLRGHVGEDLDRYRAAFDASQATAAERLRQVGASASEVGMPGGTVERMLDLHGELASRYAAALTALEPGAMDAAWRADRAVRGMDRPLNDAFDALVADVRGFAEARRQALREETARVAEQQRLVLIAAHGGGIALVLLSLVMALGATRRR
jgi:hypothetical protein